MIERCERYFRSLDELIAEHRRARRPGGDRRVRLRPRLRADPGRVPRQLVARAAGLPDWAGGTSQHEGARGHRRRLRRDDAPRARARLVAHASPTQRRPRARGSTSSTGSPAATDPMPEDARAKIARRARRGAARGAAARRRPAAGRGGVDARAGVRRPLRGSSAPTSRWCSPMAARCRSCPPRRSSRAASSRAAITAGRGSSSPRARASAPGARSRNCRSSTWRRCCCTCSVCPCPKTWPAAFPTAIFEAGELERRPRAAVSRRRAPATLASQPGGRLELEPEEQAALMERLRALGYVE